ncbi:MAG TPA: hypothetical protein PKU78_06815, partial [Candidatus Dojkabacteria bacterium]|nr:hypothetical protein [Candidatus Dojkabacteria bacterium]
MSNTNPSLDEIWSDMYRTPAQQSSMVSEAKDYQVPSKKSRGKKKRSKLSDKDIGAIEQVNSSYEVDNLFNSILREMEEQGDFETSDDL